MMLIQSLMLLAPLHATFVDGEGTDELVLRTYDIAHLSSGGFTQYETWETNLVPFVNFEQNDEYYEDEEHSANVEEVVSLMHEVLGEELEYEGRRIDLDEHGRLFIRGPETLQRRVTELIRFLEQSVGARYELEVAAVELGEAWPEGVLVDANSLDRLFADADLAGTSWRMPIQNDRTAALDMSRTRELCIDYDVEIAQGSTVADPIIATLSSGTRMILQASPAADGINLAFTLKRGDLANVVDRRLEITGRIATEGGRPSMTTNAGVVQNYELVSRSMATTAVLPNGKGMVLATGVEGRANEVFVIRAVGEAMPTRMSFPLGGNLGNLTLLDVGATEPPRISSRGMLFGMAVLPELMPFSRDRDLLGADPITGQGGLTHDMILEGIDHNNINGLESYLAVYPVGNLDGEERSLSAAEQRRMIETFDTLVRPSDQFDVEVTVTHGDATKVRSRSLVTNGGSLTLGVGEESLGIYDYDVEVAQFAAISDPHVRPIFDGLAMWLQPSLRSDGSLAIDVRGGANLVTSVSETNLDSQFFPALDSVESLHTLVRERRVLRAAGDGSWSTVIGGGETGPRIEIVLRRP
jgi:hypothetical protein